MMENNKIVTYVAKYKKYDIGYYLMKLGDIYEING
jgi:hypothetical protein